MKKLSTLILITFFSFGCSNSMENSMNPFFTDYDAPYQIPPFDEIKEEHYMPAFDKGMKEQLEEIDQIANNPEQATFENTLVELERTGKTLSKVADVFFNLLSSNTNKQMDKIAAEISPKLSAHRDAISLNKKLYERVNAVYEQRNALGLTTEQMRLVEETHKGFIRSGVQLDTSSMEKLTQINQELSSLSVQFDQNLLKETNEGYSLLIDDENQLDGLPEDFRDQAANLAEENGHNGKWMFKPTRVSMYPFLTYSTQRDLREKLYTSYIKRGDNDNDRDNKNLAIEMADLRLERANLLGYKTHADFVLENTMAKNTGRAVSYTHLRAHET